MAGSEPAVKHCGDAMTVARREQRKRTTGWRAPKGAVFAHRPHILGNPFPTRADYARWLDGEMSEPEFEAHAPRAYYTHHGSREQALGAIEALRRRGGEVVVLCFCRADADCHGDEVVHRINRRGGP